jgi:hypothetical protein
MWFQIALITALVLIGVYLIRAEPSARHLAIRRILMLLAVVGGVFVVIAPGILTNLANLVGVGRGSDLLFYSAIVAGLLYVVHEYKRSVQLARINTQLARQLALTEARLEDRIAELEARNPGKDRA